MKRGQNILLFKLKRDIIYLMSDFRSGPNKNMRDDMNRGVSPEALADLGYEVPMHMLPEEDTKEGLEPQNPELGQESQEEQRVEQAAKKIGTVLCADCYRVVPCQHVGVRADGSRYTRGY